MAVEHRERRAAAVAAAAAAAARACETPLCFRSNVHRIALLAGRQAQTTERARKTSRRATVRGRQYTSIGMYPGRVPTRSTTVEPAVQSIQTVSWDSTVLCWPCNLYAINNSAWAETRANRVRTNNNQLLLSDGSDAYSTVYAILQYGVRIRINECTASDAVRIGCVRIGINSAGGL